MLALQIVPPGYSTAPNQLCCTTVDLRPNRPTTPGGIWDEQYPVSPGTPYRQLIELFEIIYYHLDHGRSVALRSENRMIGAAVAALYLAWAQTSNEYAAEDFVARQLGIPPNFLDILKKENSWLC